MTLCADSYPWNKLKVERGIRGFRKEMPYRTSTHRGDNNLHKCFEHMNGFGRRDQIGCQLVYNTDRWIRSIDQCDRVVCMNVDNGHWLREWLDSVIVFFLQNDWLVEY